jgi:hypothetical protein
VVVVVVDGGGVGGIVRTIGCVVTGVVGGEVNGASVGNTAAGGVGVVAVLVGGCGVVSGFGP